MGAKRDRECESRKEIVYVRVSNVKIVTLGEYT